MSSTIILRLAWLSAVIGLVGLGCSRSEKGQTSIAPVFDADIESFESTSWVKIYDPQQAWAGYTLTSIDRQIPALIDMNGRVVHAWPEARVRSRLRLLADGSLLAVSSGRGAVEYDWAGNLIWEFEPQDFFLHHDLIRLTNRNIMAVARFSDQHTDDLLEIDRGGKIIWRWRSEEHLDADFDQSSAILDDITHINSVQEIPPNHWFEAGDRRFTPGHLLISARNLSSVYIIDRNSGEVVWKYDHELDHQHEALMIGPDLPGSGNIQLYNNGYKNRFAYRQSSIIEIEPARGTKVWEYRAEGFYSPVGGVEQQLPNGNVLIVSRSGKRVFEVTRDGSIVWQWAPPFQPKRSRRYPYDHTPELAAMSRPIEKEVRQPAGYRHLDRAVYVFATKEDRRRLEIDNKKITVLNKNNVCRQLILPGDMVARVAYGIARDRLGEVGHDELAVRFVLRLHLEEDQESVLLHEGTLNLSGEASRRLRVDLAPYSQQRVTLCLETFEAGSETLSVPVEYAYWRAPVINPKGLKRKRTQEPDDLPGDLTAEELEVRKKHLEALGYID
jgi:hypothetical protein